MKRENDDDGEMEVSSFGSLLLQNRGKRFMSRTVNDHLTSGETRFTVSAVTKRKILRKRHGNRHDSFLFTR